MGAVKRLTVENFGPIGSVTIPFADITVLVGPQATGKSLVLQWLKLAIDPNRVMGTLGTHGFNVENDPQRLAGWYFGAGYQDSVRAATKVSFGGKSVELSSLAHGRRRREPHHALFVPAHRALVMGTGWPLTFRSFSEVTPFVVRDFSERVRDLLARRDEGLVFPAPRRFRREIRTVLDKALFHGGRVEVESTGLGGSQFRLVHGKTRLSTMEWTTGQREVVPLLVGLYDALPPGATGRREPIQWVIIEEPELGLHPDGVLAILLLMLEVVRRGYRLVLSTHSSLLLDALWAMQQLRAKKSGPDRLLELFGAEKTPFMRDFAAAVLPKAQSITYLDFAGDHVVSHDISTLDPLATDAATAGWGGLLGHSTQIAELLSAA